MAAFLLAGVSGAGAPSAALFDGKTLVQVKDVVIQELPPTPGAPTWDKVGRPVGKPKPSAVPAVK